MYLIDLNNLPSLQDLEVSTASLHTCI